MSRQWFKMVETEEEEEVLYSCRMIIMDMDFQELSIEIMQDNRITNITVISTYNLAENRARFITEIRGLDSQNGSICPLDWPIRISSESMKSDIQMVILSRLSMRTTTSVALGDIS